MRIESYLKLKLLLITYAIMIANRGSDLIVYELIWMSLAAVIYLKTQTRLMLAILYDITSNFTTTNLRHQGLCWANPGKKITKIKPIRIKRNDRNVTEGTSHEWAKIYRKTKITFEKRLFVEAIFITIVKIRKSLECIPFCTLFHSLMFYSLLSLT